MTTAEIWNTFFSTQFKQKDRGKENEAHPAISLHLQRHRCLFTTSFPFKISYCVYHSSSQSPLSQRQQVWLVYVDMIVFIKNKKVGFPFIVWEKKSVVQLHRLCHIYVSRKPEWSISDHQTTVFPPSHEVSGAMLSYTNWQESSYPSAHWVCPPYAKPPKKSSELSSLDNRLHLTYCSTYFSMLQKATSWEMWIRNIPSFTVLSWSLLIVVYFITKHNKAFARSNNSVCARWDKSLQHNLQTVTWQWTVPNQGSRQQADQKEQFTWLKYDGKAQFQEISIFRRWNWIASSTEGTRRQLLLSICSTWRPTSSFSLLYGNMDLFRDYVQLRSTMSQICTSEIKI